jgi:hypothetical protein
MILGRLSFTIIAAPVTWWVLQTSKASGPSNPNFRYTDFLLYSYPYHFIFAEVSFFSEALG